MTIASATHPRNLLLATTLLLLASCAPDTEDRITKAMPLSPAVLEAQHALEADQGDAGFAAEFAGRVRMRAIDCSRGRSFDWWATEDALRKSLAPDQACFAAADEALLQWLHWRRIGQVLAQPALRPLPATPTTALGGGELRGRAIRHVGFADKAGVAALAMEQSVLLFDTGDGRLIASTTVADPGPVAVSPNGRIAAIGMRDTLQLRGADGGDFGSVDGVAQGRGWWLSDTVLAFNDARDDSLRVIDFAHARESRSTELTGMHDVVPLPDQPGRVLALAKQGAAMIVVPPAGSPYRPAVSIAALPGMSLLEGDRAITPEGRVFGLAEGGVLQATRDDGDRSQLQFKGALRRLDFGGLPLQGVQPSGDPDRLLLALPGKYGAQWFAYSLSTQEVAPVDPQPAADARLEYVPELRRLVVVDGDGVRIVDHLRTGKPETFDVLAKHFGAGLATDTLAQVEPAPAKPVPPPPPPPEPASGPRAVVNGREVPVQPVEGGGPFAQINGRVIPVPNAKPSPPRAPPPPGPPLKGKAALVEGLRSGVLRLATESDLNAWKRSYEQQARHGVPREFDQRIGFGATIYVITGDYTIPDDLTGSASATFILERGAPYPNGEASHSTILDVSSGACVGWTCRSLNGED